MSHIKNTHGEGKGGGGGHVLCGQCSAGVKHVGRDHDGAACAVALAADRHKADVAAGGGRCHLLRSWAAAALLLKKCAAKSKKARALRVCTAAVETHCSGGGGGGGSTSTSSTSSSQQQQQQAATASKKQAAAASNLAASSKQQRAVHFGVPRTLFTFPNQQSVIFSQLLAFGRALLTSCVQKRFVCVLRCLLRWM